MNLYVEPGANKATGQARMREMRKVHVCGSKCMALSAFSSFPCFDDAELQVWQAPSCMNTHHKYLNASKTFVKCHEKIFPQKFHARIFYIFKYCNTKSLQMTIVVSMVQDKIH